MFLPSSARLIFRSWTHEDTALMPNVNVTVVSVCSTGLCSYVRKANLQGVPVYGGGR
jgi:hypothetical protein